MRLLRELAYPLGLTPLVLAAMSSFFWSAALSSLILGLLGSVGLGVFTLIMFKYLMSVVEESADGRMTPAPLTVKIVQALEDFRHLKLALIAMLFIGLGLLIEQAAAAPSAVWQVPLLILMPAIVAVLAIEDRLPAALNPMRLFPLMTRIGSAYLIHIALLAAVLGLASGVFDAESGGKLYLRVLALHYMLVLAAHHLGADLYRKRDALGLHATRAPERAEERRAEELAAKHANVLGQAYKRRSTDGLTLLHDFIDKSADPEATRAWAHESLLSWDQPKVPMTYTRDYVGRLLAGGETAKAVESFLATYTKWPDFYPASPFQAVMLAEAAIKHGHTKLARDVLKQLPQAFPDDADFSSRAEALLETLL